MLPGPLETVASLGRLVVTPAFWAATGATVMNWLISLIVSVAIGVPLGLLIGSRRSAEKSTLLTIDFFRTIPSIALIPLALLLLGATTSMVVAVAVLAAVWPLLIQSIYAAKAIDPMLIQVSRSFRLRAVDRIRFVLVPDVAGFIWPGFRLAVTTALLVSVGAELIGGAPGIGSAMQSALSLNQQSMMLAYVLTAAAFGLAVNTVVVALQTKLLWWHPAFRGGRA
ncbi:ABC transporter permease subunit [Salinibacterium sp. ZJ454]|uniref:ABC transporter permease n=1 Tax=Salinibacterium sp. ZJ454 TaxID=2708339 RepID=UPI00141FEDB9|nr:ABC transporter permease subunit [Salinibacterium sp. ZJ454]